MKTRQVQAHEVESMIVRFNGLKTVNQRAREIGHPLPDAVFTTLISRHLYSLVGNREGTADWLKPAQQGPKGFSMVISRPNAGEGPSLHTHKTTWEIFTALDGRFLIELGDNGEHSVVLEPFDTAVVPPGIMRRYQNVSDHPAHLMAILTGGEDNLSEIDYVPDAGESIERECGKVARETVESIGMTFTAGK